MSLQVWLPLNGDLHNQGLKQTTTVTNIGATINSSGKFGKCYSFGGGTTDLISFTSYNTTRSISFWINATKTNSKLALVDYESKLAFGFNTNGYIIPNCSGSSMQKKMYSSSAFQNGKWNHIVLIRDDNFTDVILYINGVLQTVRYGDNYWGIGTDLCYLGGRATNTSYNYSCKICDVRVYDHMLSVKEVNELSKGLALHYKLDNKIENNICDCSGYLYDATITGTATLTTGSPRYKYGITMNNRNTANRIESNSNIAFDTSYLTASFWAKANKSTNQVLFAMPKIEFGFLSGYAYINPTATAGWTTTTFITNAWNHIAITYNNGTYKLYINGTLMTNNASNNNYLHNKNTLYLLNRSYNNNYGGDATLSDFRIYTTVLSLSDIKELANTSAVIDASGNIYARELVESS